MNEVVEHEIIRQEPQAQVPVQPPASSDAATLMRMIERAVQSPDFDVARLQQLLDIKERWEKNEAEKAFLDAVAAFKANPPTVYKDKENKQYDSWYTSIGNLVNTTNAALGPHGLSTRWDVDQSEEIKVTCILRHRLGHSESCSMKGSPDDSGKKNPLQQIKSTVTYLKIATFEAVTGIASTEANVDDDGNGSGDAKGLSDSAYRDHLTNIESAADNESLDKAWSIAAKACHEAEDPKSHQALKGKVMERKAALKKAAKVAA